MVKTNELKHLKNNCVGSEMPSVYTIPEIEDKTEPVSEDILCCYNCGEVIEDDDCYNVYTKENLQPFCLDCFNEKCFCGRDCCCIVL